MKNIDKIRQMNSDELAELLITIKYCEIYDTCEECPLGNWDVCEHLLFEDYTKEWLEQESEG